MIAVEPNPKYIPSLDYSLRDHPNITLVERSIGATVDFTELNFIRSDPTANIRDDWSVTKEEPLRIEMTTPDAISGFVRPQFIKVDPEGLECAVFRGLAQAISVIYFEMYTREAHRASRSQERVSTRGEMIGDNVVAGDNARWIRGRWVQWDQVLEKRGLPLPRQSDLLVKMRCR